MTTQPDSGTVGDPDEWARAAGRRVQEERRRRGLSQEQLARDAGIAIRTLSSIEHGDSSVRPGNRRVIFDALGIDPTRLVSKADDPTPEQARMGAEFARRWIAGRPTDSERDAALDAIIQLIGKNNADQ